MYSIKVIALIKSFMLLVYSVIRCIILLIHPCFPLYFDKNHN